MRYMFKCRDCGKKFYEDEAETRSEYVGDFCGSPAYTNIFICPECRSGEIEIAGNSDYEEVEESEE